MFYINVCYFKKEKIYISYHFVVIEATFVIFIILIHFSHLISKKCILSFVEIELIVVISIIL